MMIQAHVLLIFSCVALSLSLRFGPKSVSVDTEVLIVGRPARLTCNYVKYRTENVRDIRWYAGYTGFRTKVRK
jgi:hypothetical protein